MRLYKTETGHTAFKQRSPLFSARQRSLFILFDGRKSLQDVLTDAAGMGLSQTDVDYLLGLGFLSPQASDLPPDTGAAPLEAMAPEAMAAEALIPPAEPSPSLSRTEQQRYFDAKPIATQLTASLGLRGFLLNLAVEGAAGYPELLKLLPKIQSALGTKACRKLERALLD